MQYVIDIALVAFFGLIVFTSAKKGFFQTLFELGAYLVSVVSAKVLSASIAPKAYESFLKDMIREKLTEALGTVAEADYSASAAAAIDSVPEQFNGVLQAIGIDKAQLAEQVSSKGFSGKQIVDTLMDNFAQPVSTAVIRILLFIVISFVLSIILRVVVKALGKVIKKLPVIGNINSGLGAFVGVIKGLLVVVLFALLISAAASFTTYEPLIQAVNSSMIIKGINGIIVSISGYRI